MTTEGTKEGPGDKGVGLPVRGHLRFLQRRLALSERVLDDEMGQAVKFAREVLDDPKASHRDRLRAGELLRDLSDRGVNIAEVLDKAERLDAGKPTENFGGTIRYIKGVDEDAL